MAMEMIAMESDNASIAGICQIIDLEKMTFEHMRQFDGIIFKKWCTFYRDCFPVKIKEVFVLNTPKEIQRLISFIKSLTPTNLGFEVFVYQNFKLKTDF